MNAPNQSGWKPEMTLAADGMHNGPATTTGNRALMLEEPLLFEIGRADVTGVDLPPVDATAPTRLAGLARSEAIGLVGLTEPETVRHYTRLSRQNYGIDLGFFPLGSCTMKHNPRLNEKVARLPGFADIHPLAPQNAVQGALELIHQLGQWLCTLTGMPAVAMSPKAGAHGELCGILAIRAAHEARGDAREVVLVPESAHGTNPATAAFANYRVEDIPATPEGRVDVAALKARLGPDVAAVMITNPNTCGLFEKDFREIADAVAAEVASQLALLPRREIAAASWDAFGAIIVVDDLMGAVTLIDRLAPEHLEICTADPEPLAAAIRNAGAMFLGHHTPEAIGDYVGGPNHVLPTARSARFSSGLGVLDFMKRTTLLKCSADALRALAPAAATLGEAESLQAHARSVTIRLNL
jgi:hypothetical protein